MKWIKKWESINSQGYRLFKTTFEFRQFNRMHDLIPFNIIERNQIDELFDKIHWNGDYLFKAQKTRKEVGETELYFVRSGKRFTSFINLTKFEGDYYIVGYRFEFGIHMREHQKNIEKSYLCEEYQGLMNCLHSILEENDKNISLNTSKK